MSSQPNPSQALPLPDPPSEKVASFHLLVEPSTAGEDASREREALIDLPCGTGVLALALDDASDAPRLHPLPPDAAADDERVLFEAIRAGRGSALLMLASPELDARVNGLPAPRLSLLDVADQVQALGRVIHVTRFRDVCVGPPTPEQCGRRCPVCGEAIDAETRVFVCECNAVLHAEPDGARSARELLQCAQLGTCPDCARPVSMTTGFVYTPE